MVEELKGNHVGLMSCGFVGFEDGFCDGGDGKWWWNRGEQKGLLTAARFGGEAATVVRLMAEGRRRVFVEFRVVVLRVSEEME